MPSGRGEGSVIPNNINLEDKPALQRQLLAYQAGFKNWWDERGPEEFHQVPMYLRCPVGCDSAGWAQFRFVRPADYQWGLFQIPAHERAIEFGRNAGKPVWSTVPEEYRGWLVRHIAVQADAEPGSVEQSRLLSRSAPSLYDLRNLFQFLLEEARHLWALVHVLLEHFGTEGQNEAQALLERQCGNGEQPRLLNAFNVRNEDWLSYFIWCFLADRDGKYQLSAVQRGGFDPLARTAAFMLMEEPLHLSIGTHGLERVIERTVALMRAHDTESVFPFGGIPLSVIQKYLNFWTPQVFDLFGSDESERARDMFLSGLRDPTLERYRGDTFRDDLTVTVDRHIDGRVEAVAVPLIDALNADMRMKFTSEANVAIARWNRQLREAGIDFQLSLPHPRFNRRIGPCRELNFTPTGRLISADEASSQTDTWLPTAWDRAQVQGLMQQVLVPRQYAGWIAPPRLGINKQSPIDFEYVLL